MKLNSDFFSAKQQFLLIAGTALITIPVVVLSFVLERYVLLAIPLLIGLSFVAVINYKVLFYLFWFSLPGSIPYDLPSGMNLDLFSEPLMLVLFFIFLLRLGLDFSYFAKIPINKTYIMLFLMFIWIVISSIFSTEPLISLKYTLSKVWYFGSIIGFSLLVIREPGDFRRWFWVLYWVLLILAVVTIIRHGLMGFTFAAAHHDPMYPYYSNHVTYACIMALFFPYLLSARKWYPKDSNLRKLLNFSILFWIVAIIISYTRASWIAIILLPLLFLIIKFRLTKLVLLLSLAITTIFVSYLLHNQNYLQFAPVYEKTVFNKNDFSKHLTATYQMKDVSGVERLYRWVAAKNMIAEHPITGFGPNSFTFQYKPFAESRFRTYVSDNVERSSTHNYFLLVASEQGIPGLILFTLFIAFILIRGENLYHNLKYESSKSLVVAATLSFGAMIFHLFLNDLVEVDKLGSLFFFVPVLLLKVEKMDSQDQYFSIFD